MSVVSITEFYSCIYRNIKCKTNTTCVEIMILIASTKQLQYYINKLIFTVHI